MISEYIIQEFSDALGIPYSEVENDEGVVQFQFEKSGMFTVELAPDGNTVLISMAKEIEYFRIDRHGLQLMSMARYQKNANYPIKVGLLGESLVVLSVRVPLFELSTQALFDVLDLFCERIYELAA